MGMPAVALLAFCMASPAAFDGAGDPRPEAALHDALSVRTVADLARACRGMGDAAQGETGQGETVQDDEARLRRLFACLGYVRGAVAMYEAYQEATGVRTICLPEAASYAGHVESFLAWAEGSPDRGEENAAQGFLTSLLHRFRCGAETDD
jgi:hypothetical protein